MQKSDFSVVIQALNKTYQLGGIKVEVLKNLKLTVLQSEFVAICGHSGSGKTTLLNILSGIDKPTNGKVLVLGENLTAKEEDFLADFRCNHVGFVFQSYNLVSTLTVAENIAFPMEWKRKTEAEIETRVAKLLETVGLEGRATHFPAQLSGGEQQRVAFARALANNPELILADEPTGNLDVKNALKVTEMLKQLKAEGKTVVVATHDPELTRFADRVLFLKDGNLVEEVE